MDGQTVMLLFGFLRLFVVNSTISDCTKKVCLSWEQHDENIVIKCKYCEIKDKIFLDSPFWKGIATCYFDIQQNGTKYVGCDVVKRFQSDYKVKPNEAQKDIVLSTLHKTALESVDGAWTCRHGSRGESSEVVIKMFTSEDDCWSEAIISGLTGFGVAVTIGLIIGKFGCGLRKRYHSCCEGKFVCRLRKRCHSCCEVNSGQQKDRERTRCDLFKESAIPCFFFTTGFVMIVILGRFVTEKPCIAAICGSITLGLLCGISFLVILSYCKKDKRARTEEDQLSTASTSRNDDPDGTDTASTSRNDDPDGTDTAPEEQSLTQTTKV